MQLTPTLGVTTFAALVGAASAVTNEQIFARPVISRAYEQKQWVLRASNGSGVRETAEAVGHALAGLKPSYVSGLIYLQSTTQVEQNMIDDWHTIRSAVRAASPGARFDVEMSLNPNPPSGNPFASADALVEKMKEVDAVLQPGGWWFDFYSNAQKEKPDWIKAAVQYAHSHNQTIGGNVFNSVVPPGSDAVAFVDDPVSGSKYGFDFNKDQVKKLKSAAKDTVIIGHLQSNPQNGDSTESCVYMQQWNEAKRMSYLKYWASEQCSVGFTFMWPVFYPLCPGAFAFDPTTDDSLNGSTLYKQLQAMIDAGKGC